MVDLIATKSMTYATRRLKADDGFGAKPRDARILVAIGKARYATADAIAADTAPAAKPDDIKALRDAYQAKTGKRPFMGWDADALRTKIAEA